MTYAATQDIFNIFGKTNVKGWADIENTDNPDVIAARYAWALGRGDDEVDTRLNGKCSYSVPFVSVPALITHLAAQWAGIELYESRGITDYDVKGRAVNSLQIHVDRFTETIVQICSGLRNLGLPRIATSIPLVVRERGRNRNQHTIRYGPDNNGIMHPMRFDEQDAINDRWTW